MNPMLATAEAGGTGGGQLAVASSSGTNRLHGNTFEFLRNNVFDARQPVPFNSAQTVITSQQPLRLNQFGARSAGPSHATRLSFYLAYEGYRQHWGFPLLGYVPERLVPCPSGGRIASPGFNSQRLSEGQIPTINPDVNQFASEGRQVVSENSGMFRLDHHFSNSDNRIRPSQPR